MSTWLVYLKDGATAQVVADEVLIEGCARFVNNHLDGTGAERYVDVLLLAASTWARIESADAKLTWTPALVEQRVPERF